jgi:hypothetical protein
MRLPRFRIRSLMIGVAFMALVLSLILQTVLLQRAAVREQRPRAEAELRRAQAEAETQRAQAILDRSRQEAGERSSVEDASIPKGSK